jgi:membrane protease YdiL (CAAX protease family)
MRTKLPVRGDLLMLFFMICILTLALLSGSLLPALGIEVSRLGHGLLVQVGGWFGLFALYLLITKQKPSDMLLLKAPSVKQVLLAVILSLATIPITFAVMMSMEFLWNLIFPSVDSSGAVLVTRIAAVPLWHRLIFNVAVPATGEELWFRGVFYNAYRRQGLSIGKIAVITGLFFGAMHGIARIPDTLLISVIIAYSLYYTRSIWIPVLMHTLVNLILVLMGAAFGYSTEAQTQQGFITGNIDIDLIIFYGFISLIMIPIVILCFKKFKKYHAAAQLSESADSDIIGERDTSAKVKVFTWAFGLTVAISLGYALLNDFGII